VEFPGSAKADSFAWVFEAYKAGKTFAAFDLETTGLDPKEDRIVEIGAVTFDRRGPLCRYSVLVNPGIPMPAAAGRVNNITDAMLSGKPPLEKVLPDFIRLINNTIILAHNAPFDCGFINEKLSALYAAGQKREASGLFEEVQPAGTSAAWTPPFPGLPGPSADTLVLSRQAFPGRTRYALQELAGDLGLTAAKAHRADDDAVLCMELFIRCFDCYNDR
jgi:DNA polymerase-3 subunit epsilon